MSFANDANKTKYKKSCGNTAGKACETMDVENAGTGLAKVGETGEDATASKSSEGNEKKTQACSKKMAPPPPLPKALSWVHSTVMDALVTINHTNSTLDSFVEVIQDIIDTMHQVDDTVNAIDPSKNHPKIRSGQGVPKLHIGLQKYLAFDGPPTLLANNIPPGWSQNIKVSFCLSSNIDPNNLQEALYADLLTKKVAIYFSTAKEVKTSSDSVLLNIPNKINPEDAANCINWACKDFEQKLAIQHPACVGKYKGVKLPLLTIITKYLEGGLFTPCCTDNTFVKALHPKIPATVKKRWLYLLCEWHDSTELKKYFGEDAFWTVPPIKKDGVGM